MSATDRMASATVGSGMSSTTIGTSDSNHSCTFVFLEGECDLTIRVSTIMFFITIFTILFGTIANCLVIGVILAVREMRTIPSIYIANLALTDVLVLFFVGGLNCYEYYIGAFQPEEFRTVLSFELYLQLVTAMATVIMMTALTIDRFFAIVYPLRSQRYRTKKVAIIVSVGVWIFSFCFGGIYFGAPIKNNRLEAWKEPNAEHFVTIGTIFSYIIPLFTIFVCYTAILRTIYKNRISGERASDTTRKRRAKQKHAVLRASVLVVVLFAIIQGFFLAVFLWIAYGGSRLVEPSVAIIVYNVSQGLYLLNSLINPFLYALSHDRFYRTIWRVVSCSSVCVKWKKSMKIQLPTTMTPSSSVNGKGSVASVYVEGWKTQGVYNLAYDVHRPEASTRL